VVLVDNPKAIGWLAKGAQPTETVRKLLTISGAWGEFEATKPPKAKAPAKPRTAKAPTAKAPQAPAAKAPAVAEETPAAVPAAASAAPEAE
jgi:small subunit ribosomal protein S16